MDLEKSKVKLFKEISEPSQEDIERVLKEFTEKLNRSDRKCVGSEDKIVINPGAQPKSHKQYRT